MTFTDALSWGKETLLGGTRDGERLGYVLSGNSSNFDCDNGRFNQSIQCNAPNKGHSAVCLIPNRKSSDLHQDVSALPTSRSAMELRRSEGIGQSRQGPTVRYGI